MRRGGRAPLDNPVSGCHKILLLHDDVREGAVHHNPNLPKTFEAGRQWGAEVVNEVPGVEQMSDPVYVVLVFEDPGEFTNDLFVLVLLHGIPSSKMVVTTRPTDRSGASMSMSPGARRKCRGAAPNFAGSSR